MGDAEASMALLEAALSSGDDDGGDSSGSVSSDSIGGGGGYGSDLYGDEEDRASLMAMPELQREQILLKRQEQMLKSKERNQAQIKWRLEQSKKRSRAAAAVDDGGAGRSRRTKKNVSGVAAAMEDIRGRRNKQIRARQSELYSDHDDDDDEAYSGGDDDDKDEVGSWEESRHGKQQLQQRRLATTGAGRAGDYDLLSHRTDAHLPIDHETMCSLQVRRSAIEKMMDEPYFRDITRGMFCRVALGVNNITGEHVYRAVTIVDVIDYPRTYAVGSRETNKALMVSFGSAETVFKLALISSHGITLAEAGQWMRAMQKDHIPIMTIGAAITLKLASERLRRTFKYTPEMVDAMVTRNQKGRGGTTTNVTRQMIDLRRDLELARQAGDSKRVVEVESRIDGIQEHELTMRRRQDTSVDQLNQKIRAANKKNSEAANAALVQRSVAAHGGIGGRAVLARPFSRRSSAANASASSSPHGGGAGALPSDDDELLPMMTHARSSEALRMLVQAHDVPLQIDAAGAAALRPCTYQDRHPISFLISHPASDRTRFTQILTLQQWRQKRGLE